MEILGDPSTSAYKKARRQHLKTTRNREHDADINWTPFRAAEKRYKARFPPPDLSQVLDLATLDKAGADRVAKASWSAVGVQELTLAPNTPNSSQAMVKSYTLSRVPGKFSRAFQRDFLIGSSR
jgi:alkylated DNA repair protein alkB family protein 1